MNTFDVIIFDLDGTLTNTEHRNDLIPIDAADSDKSWDAFSLASKFDLPQAHIILLAQLLFNHCNQLLIFSGRGEIAREDTVEWLISKRIRYDELVMRPIGNGTPDTVLKQQWYNERDLFVRKVMVFEDRNRVVEMWRSIGVRCLQVASGGF